jgi:hypothetical protein
MPPRPSPTPPSKRLRLWLIVVTIVTLLALIAAVPSTLFATWPPRLTIPAHA